MRGSKWSWTAPPTRNIRILNRRSLRKRWAPRRPADCLLCPVQPSRLSLILQRGVGSCFSASIRCQVQNSPDRPDRIEGAVVATHERQLAGPPVVDAVLVAGEHVEDRKLFAPWSFPVVVAVEGVVLRGQQPQ